MDMLPVYLLAPSHFLGFLNSHVIYKRMTKGWAANLYGCAAHFAAQLPFEVTSLFGWLVCSALLTCVWTLHHLGYSI